ncbi:response regulator transcription factor [Rhizobium johnstonii]|uniref:response regulator transcription factor n=1 Tax=Rhizobium johnstonii TaxID=3019933 RepID=UPI003F9C0AA0
MSEPHITPRESEIIKLLCDGKTGPEMATILDLSIHTVYTYQVRLREKFGVYKDTALVAAAFRNGIIT